MRKCGICGHFNCVASYFHHPTEPFSNIGHPYIIGKDCMYKDELPENMPDGDYDDWFLLSEIVDGARIGPMYPPNHNHNRPMGKDHIMDEKQTLTAKNIAEEIASRHGACPMTVAGMLLERFNIHVILDYDLSHHPCDLSNGERFNGEKPAERVYIRQSLIGGYVESTIFKGGTASDVRDAVLALINHK